MARASDLFTMPQNLRFWMCGLGCRVRIWSWEFGLLAPRLQLEIGPFNHQKRKLLVALWGFRANGCADREVRALLHRALVRGSGFRALPRFQPYTISRFVDFGKR